MILVTGGTGLIGAHLLYDLAQKGERVRALCRKESKVNEVKKIFSYYTSTPDELFSKIEWADGDLLDIPSLEEAMNGITHIYHCAAIVSMNPRDGEGMIRNNVAGTANIVNIALEKKIKKFCHVSSVASLGIEPDKEITENTHWNEKTNFSAYAISKYLSENEVWRAQQEGLEVVIVNPSVVIGPGNWRRSSGDIFIAGNKGYRWYSEGSIGYVDVRDVTKAMIALQESEIKNEKFILSSENLPYRKFLDLVYASLGKPLPNKKAGRIVMGLGWRADKIRSKVTRSKHILTREVARYSRMKLSYSNAKVKKAIGIDFRPVSEAIRETSVHFIADRDRG